MAYTPYRSGPGGSPNAVVRLERPLSLGSNVKQPGLLSTTSVPNSRPKSTSTAVPAGRRHSPGSLRNGRDNSAVPGRVRVAVRLRPRNAEEMRADADFGDCVELQPELKRLRLRKNNWDYETFQFDEVLAESASQKRVYEVVAKPVVEGVLEGYNGTVMAYGQTGTGKTFTLGKLGEEDTADRGIMVRAMEDILADISPEQDSVSVSYLQLYMETVQDLLAPEKDNIVIVEDPKSGDVSLLGATLVEVADQQSLVQLLQTGEANRFAANTRLNTESSRSHAILLVYVKKTVKAKQDRELVALNENGTSMQLTKGQHIPIVRKSKLLIVDLAGSERANKSGSEGHTLEEAKYINLSLTALGKCINALAENSSHVPIRDSKLTRLLRDSFGGTARTSLIITVGPSPQHRAETASTIMFGQRAMKVENMIKLKEEFDYKSLCRKLETDLDKLIAENERQAKAIFNAEEEMERELMLARNSVIQAEIKLIARLEEMTAENVKLQKELNETFHKLEQEQVHRERMEKELLDSTQNLYILKESERERHQQEIQELMQKHREELSKVTQKLQSQQHHMEALEKEMQQLMEVTEEKKEKTEVGNQEQVMELEKQLEMECRLRKQAEKELRDLHSQLEINVIQENGKQSEKMNTLENKLEEQLKQREMLEHEVKNLKQQLLQLSYEADETRRSLDRESSGRISNGSDSQMSLQKGSHLKNTINGQRATIAKLFEQVGLQKILSLLESEDIDVRVHAVKVVANLAAEEANQEKIVEAGGLRSLLMLLQNSEDETIRRVAAGAVANLAMNERNQELIMAQGGIRLLARTANESEDPQTMRMVAGAIANLCGNDKLQSKLREEAGIRALLGMVRSRHPDVLAQVARGIANFAKCESRGVAQGHKKGKSLLIEDGALPWIVANAGSEASPIRRHIELALCHLAQHEANTKDLIAAGALTALVRVSKKCSRDDIRSLAKRTITKSTTFQKELKGMQLLEN